MRQIEGAVAREVGKTRPTWVGARANALKRPPEVWSLIALELIGAGGSFGAAFVPGTMHRFVGLGLSFGSAFIAVALGLWFLWFRVGKPALFISAVLVIGAMSMLTASALTAQGTLATAFTFIWMAVYAAAFFSPRQVYVILVLSAGGLAGGLAANGISRWVGIWILLTATIAAIAIVLNHAMERIRRESETDVLTGLLNRRGFLKAAAMERSIADRIGVAVGLAVIDLDDFKSINDQHGHAAGDRVLSEATSAWKRELSEADLLARFGGDEFVMLVPSASLETIEAILDRCRLAHAIRWTAGTSLWISGEPLEQCLERADEHLYMRKLQKRASRKPGSAVAG